MALVLIVQYEDNANCQCSSERGVNVCSKRAKIMDILMRQVVYFNAWNSVVNSVEQPYTQSGPRFLGSPV